MSQRVTAIYENGVLRPLVPLNLPEHARVELNVEAASSAPAASAQAVRDALRSAGASVSPLPLSNAATQPLSDEEQAALARRFAGERPLGDTISDDRDGREF
ncbi:MAG: antitoxin family protein [Pyrinomonadaceae bacterium MAG19_C2-C3]|nr:antitoxin family protein [Pyrinomonadaceae bacterium MAG19_C2-C3]